MSKLLPSFKLLSDNYLADPDPEKVKQEIGKDVDQDYLVRYLRHEVKPFVQLRESTYSFGFCGLSNKTRQ